MACELLMAVVKPRMWFSACVYFFVPTNQLNTDVYCMDECEIFACGFCMSCSN